MYERFQCFLFLYISLFRPFSVNLWIFEKEKIQVGYFYRNVAFFQDAESCLLFTTVHLSGCIQFEMLFMEHFPIWSVRKQIDGKNAFEEEWIELNKHYTDKEFHRMREKSHCAHANKWTRTRLHLTKNYKIKFDGGSYAHYYIVLIVVIWLNNSTHFMHILTLIWFIRQRQTLTFHVENILLFCWSSHMCCVHSINFWIVSDVEW